MKICRLCKVSQPSDEFVVRGYAKITDCCNSCSSIRVKKDYCEHQTRYHDCRYCNDGRIITARKSVHSSRLSDKKHNRLNDLFFDWNLEQLMDNPLCYYCKCVLQYESPYEKDFATFDRINDAIGHIQTNCLISCRNCNCAQNKFKYILKV